MFQINLPHNSNDAHIWSSKDPDVELVEPRIMVSMNRNYLVFGRKVSSRRSASAVRVRDALLW